jgi:predicted DNA-binding protein (MmcQ/YjbR family)
VPMGIDALRKLCLSFPFVTEQVQWGNDLLFKVGGKMFALAPLEPAPVSVTFKCTPEGFADLTERQGIIPAPYLARAQWVALERWDALQASELAEFLRTSYDLVFEKLPAGIRADLVSQRPSSPKKSPTPSKPKKSPPRRKKRAPR